jgi:hypothetical protein
MSRTTSKTRTSFVAAFGALLAVASCVSEDPGSAIPSCNDYCTEIMRTCGGEKLQYKDIEQCAKTCAFMEPGTLEDNGNSIGCRLRKVRAATTLADCVAAGPYGGGVCGTRCGMFCKIIKGNCFGTSTPPYGGSEATCNETCNTYKLDPTEGEGPLQAAFPGKNSLNCRSHHLILSLADPEGHCPHADESSIFCPAPDP